MEKKMWNIIRYHKKLLYLLQCKMKFFSLNLALKYVRSF